MPDIRVAQPHKFPVAEAKERLKSFAELLSKYKVNLDWQGTHAKLGGVPGVGGHVDVKPDQVEVLVSLSRMVTMMGVDPVKLEGSIKRRLQEALGS